MLSRIKTRKFLTKESKSNVLIKDVKFIVPNSEAEILSQDYDIILQASLFKISEICQGNINCSVTVVY